MWFMTTLIPKSWCNIYRDLPWKIVNLVCITHPFHLAVSVANVFNEWSLFPHSRKCIMDRKIKNSLCNTHNSPYKKLFQVLVETADQTKPKYSWASASCKGLCLNSISQLLGFIAFRQAQFIPLTVLEKVHFRNCFTSKDASTHYPKILLRLIKKGPLI